MKAAVSPHAQVSQDKSKMMGLRPKTKFVSPIPPTPFSSKCNVKIEDRNDLNILFPTPFSKVLKYNVNVFFNILLKKYYYFDIQKRFDRLSFTSSESFVPLSLSFSLPPIPFSPSLSLPIYRFWKLITKNIKKHPHKKNPHILLGSREATTHHIFYLA